MCIFTSSVAAVSDTRIFARMAGPGRQYLAYEMSFAALGDTAMVLPLPVASHDESTALRFIDLSRTPDFFDRIAAFVTMFEERRRRDPDDDSLSAGSEAVGLPLMVHEVGAFEASFVPSIADFDRLDARFRLAPEVWERLPQYRDYGFAVFKLAATGAGARHAHPMAFEFSTRHADRLYAPTVHVHDGSVAPLAWFDHVVFVQGEHLRVPRRVWFENGIQAGEAAYSDAKQRWDELRQPGDWRLRREQAERERFGVILRAEHTKHPLKASGVFDGERLLALWRTFAPSTRVVLLRLEEQAKSIDRQCLTFSAEIARAGLPTQEELAAFPAIARWMQIVPELGLEADTLRCWLALGAADRKRTLNWDPPRAGDAAAQAWMALYDGQRNDFGSLSKWKELPPLLETQSGMILEWMERHAAPRVAAARFAVGKKCFPLFERAPEALLRCAEARSRLRAPEIRAAVLALEPGIAPEDARCWRELELEYFNSLPGLAQLDEFFPLFDAAQEIEAVGLSGVLPNRDTLIKAA